MNEQPDTVREEDLQAYVDGTLAGERRAQVEAWLERNPAEAARVGDYFALNGMLRDRYDRVLDEPVPSRLRIEPKRRWRDAVNWPRFAMQAGGLAAALALGIGLGAGFNGMRDTVVAQRGDPAVRVASMDADNVRMFARQSALAHVVYAPDVVRPVEVGADREHEMPSWLSRQLGTSMPAPVLTSVGLELMGGRMLPGKDGPVAQYMYRDRGGMRVTLCISHRKAPSDVTAFQLYKDGPVNVFYWIDGDFGYSVSGGIDSAKLLAIAESVYTQLAPGGAKPTSGPAPHG
ncbi:anti-sigma factor RsiW [Paraburkholderia caballeronis]|uniref:anti-sigma factor family protein n=1 Tax=Paraburkholderia caballeronis TaxID=416943 RepID=UPI0010656F6B|nr:anti-sigma factor [Paraburkholderia caballeronis]TDV34481.1 anti-sigma factor RsiW [Paraburkholderia caballeronis]